MSMQRVLAVMLALQMSFGYLPVYVTLAHAEELTDQPAETLVLEEAGGDAAADPDGQQQPSEEGESAADEGDGAATDEPANDPGEYPVDEPAADPADKPVGEEKDEVPVSTEGDASDLPEGENPVVDSEKADEAAGNHEAPVLLAGPLRAPSNIVTEGINNPANTTVNLFDYWITGQGDDDRNGNAAGYHNGQVVNQGINQNHTLLFHGGSGGAHPQDCAADTFTEQIGPYGTPSEVWGPVAQGLVTSTLDDSGYPRLNGQYTYNDSDPFLTIEHSDDPNSDSTVVRNLGNNTFDRFNVRENCDANESLAYLFDPDNPQEGNGRKSYTDVNGLFSVDTEGYYIYDSGVQKADYNPTTNRFELGDQPAGMNGFWPLDDEGSGVHNDYSGMHMQMTFSMPANGMVLNPQGQYVPMAFTFAGDDDVWVYVDGVLVGDVGGIHQPSSLEINFMTGDVNVNRNFHGVYNVNREREEGWPEYVATTNLYERYAAAGRTDSTGWNGNTFADGTYHTIDFFYLERGNNESNLVVRFNMINTADFTAHKALYSNPQRPLQHDEFQFELIGLDGKYMYDAGTGTTTPVAGEESTTALMPKDADTHRDPDADPEPGDVSRYWYRDDANSRWVYRVGAAADGNINFGNADFMHAQRGETYRYILREVSAASSDVTMDERVYYMEATVAYDEENEEYYLQKRYYSDETYTTRLTDVNFASFVNLEGDVPSAVPTLTVGKDLTQDGSLTAIRAGQFAFEAVDSRERAVATCEASGTDNKAFATIVLPTLTPVDFEGRAGTNSYEYTVREVVPAGATDNGDGTFTVDGITYRYNPDKTIKASFTATFDGNSITLSSVTYSENPVEFHNEVVPATLTVVKTWKSIDGGEDAATHDNDSVWVQLYKQTRTDESSAWSVDEKVGDPVELNEDCSWTCSYDLPATGTGSNVRYIAREGTMSDGEFFPLAENGVIMAAKSASEDAGVPYILDSTTWTGDGVTADSDGYASVPDYGAATETIANKPAVTKVTVEKRWNDSEPASTHPDVWVQLYKDGNPEGGPVQLTDDDPTHVFSNLVPTGVFTVAEGTFDGTTFTPTTLFALEGDQTKYYTQESVTYYDAGSSEAREDPNLNGTVFPDAGSVVIVNKPLQAVITLLKVDADSQDGTEPIANVSFSLLVDAEADDEYNPETDNVVVVGGSVTTSADGTVALPSLDPGTYWLLETDVPDGYLMRETSRPIGIRVTVDGGALTVSLISDPDDTDKIKPELSQPEDGVYVLKVKNVRVYALPSAGGPGVYPFLTIGAFAAAFAVTGTTGSRKRTARHWAGRR